ncbi:tetratricopeptide repeat protein [Nonlabens sp. SCSIO 43208]|uniref:transglutaminase domain-containing protein n=1 Tax=Nonlabens sp. SCSIO 43208 TaxID=2793009 RepID=UPI003D6A3276
MRKPFQIALIIFLMVAQGALAQNPTITSTSKSLLNNNRAKALTTSKKLKKNNIEEAFLRKLTETENGQIDNEYEFLESFIKLPGFEPYLYAGWDSNIFLGDYRDEGFSPAKLKVLKKIKALNTNDVTIRDGYKYVQSLVLNNLKEFDDRQDIKQSIPTVENWEFVGPFENLNESGMDIQYEPELQAVSANGFDTKGNGIVNWYKPNLIKDRPYFFFVNHDEYGDKVSYAQTFINSDKDQRVTMSLGRGGLIKVFVNDALAFESDEDVQTEMDANRFKVSLKKGVNRILIKMASSDTNYFMLRFMDDENNILPLNGDLSNKSYTKQTISDINPEVITHPFESFFENKIQENPDNVINIFSLYSTYLRNGRVKKARAFLEPYIEKYPNSTIIKVYLIEAYAFGDDEKDEKMLQYLEDLKREDSDYYQSLVLEFLDTEKLFKKDVKSFETFIKKVKKATTLEQTRLGTDFFLAIRKEEPLKAKAVIDQIVSSDRVSLSTKVTFINFYKTLFKNENLFEKQLENLEDDYFTWQIMNKLGSHYYQSGRKREYEKFMTKHLGRYDFMNANVQRLARIKYDLGKFDESLEILDKALENYPYALRVREMKGDIYLKKNDKKNALKWYEEKLARSASNLSLRRKIFDLKDKKDPFEIVKEKDRYEFIEANRGQNTENEYGLTILSDENLIMLYERGGSRFYANYIYEITSDNGIEIMKEYDLGLYGNYYIDKSEIVKPNGSVEQAERSGSNMVFNNLEIGDVIYISYESEYGSYGRFYKDYDNVFSAQGYHPIKEYSLRIITENNQPLNYEVLNGNMTFKNIEVDGMKGYEWTANNVPGIGTSEDYMKPMSDIGTRIHISTIKNWNEISDWYSDLVRSQIEVEDEVKNVIAKIFPNGHAGLTDEQKAKTIYDFITDEFTYSYVSFKQSGYVPQKPSKTITSKLGDCKDFSTLFVALASQVDLDANLVLILTSDYGENSLRLPSRDFNHCIVKSKIDGEEYFIELTDKFLPFKSFPETLDGAIALEIPFNATGSTNDIFNLKEVNFEPSIVTTDAIVTVTDDNYQATITTDVSSSASSYLRSLLDEESEKLKKENLESFIKNRSNEEIKLNELITANYEHESNKAILKAQVEVKAKPAKIGSLKTFKIPLFSQPYTKGIVEKDERQHDIVYKYYENANKYIETTLIEIPSGKQFIEIPENKSFNYKNHSYSMTFNKISANKVEVKIISETDTADISKEEYAAFKSYVNNIMETREQYFAYK